MLVAKIKNAVPTERDRQLLEWIGQQYYINLDHLHILIELWNQRNKETPGFERRKDKVTLRNVKYTVYRWRQAGWIETKRSVDAPLIVYVTQLGMDIAELELPLWKPGERLNHKRAVNVVRLYAEIVYGNEAQWISERLLAKLSDFEHKVDGRIEFITGDYSVIEVELNLKTAERFERILQALKREFDDVWYILGDRYYFPIKRAIEGIPGHESTFSIYQLSDLVTMVQEKTGRPA